MCTDFPGPAPNFLFGNILELGTNPKTIVPSTVSFLNDYGDNVKLWIGPFKYFILTRDVDVIQYFLTSKTDIAKSENYELSKSFVGDGLFTSTGSKWRTHRKIIDPAFHYSMFDHFSSIFNEKLNIFINKVENHDCSETIDVKSWIHMLTFDANCEAIMGTKLNSQLENSPFMKAFENILYTLTSRIFSPTKRFDFLFKWTSDFTRYSNSLKIIQDLCDKCIKESNIKDINSKVDENKSFINILLKSCGDEMTEQDIKEQVKTFLFAGHDTVSTAISFALYEIAKNEKIQSLIFEEVSQILDGDLSQNVTLSQVNDMKYLDLVMKETLRKYPSAPSIERCVHEDVQIGKYFFPKGVTVNMLIYGIHHDAKHFPEPNKFDPNRFLKPTVPFSYIPFSSGPRNCIGRRYATVFFKTVIAKIVGKYHLTVPEDFKVQLALKITLACTTDIPIYFKKRA